MATELLADGTVSWIGGMDTSRSAVDLSEIQYSKGCNVITPNSLGGIRVRFGFHCAHLQFDSDTTKEIYQKGNCQGEGYFESNGKTFLIYVCDGYVLKFTKVTTTGFYVETLNLSHRNTVTRSRAWVITIPNGCIVNNGFDYPIIITESGARRSKPKKGDIGIGQMGVYVQHRLFYVDQSGRRILASDFLQPTKFTREDTNIFGFICPDESETITAIGKQKSILGTVEGGNLIWSSNKDIYSADVRGSRSDWANLGSKVGKTTETVPGISAASSYSFESFGTNIYFRSKQFGICDLKQSEYQFVNLDALNSQSIEAAYYLDNDTDWMLGNCYTRACNKRLFTTVAPERNDDGYIYWNGILSFHPSVMYSNQGTTPRRFESVFTGVRPWCLTLVSGSNDKDTIFVHSYDKDGVTRLYVMDESSDFDVDQFGNILEIEGFIETKAYTLGNPYLIKTADHRSYKLGLLNRTTHITVFSRPEPQGEWSEMADNNHLVCRNKININLYEPANHKPQTRSFVNLPEEAFSQCHDLGKKFFAVQYRIEFKGPMQLDSFIVTGRAGDYDKTLKEETDCITLIYSYRPDYGYSITPPLQ